jgi:hypothetical protein
MEGSEMNGKFELTFVGGIRCRYRRFHATFDQARETAGRILTSMDLSGNPAEQRAAHPAIIYGPFCGRDGVTIA